MDYIDENFRRKLLLGEIARREGLTMPYLSHLFKDTLGMSFQEYLKKRRFEYARSLLLGTRKSLLDISLESGFSDARYMIRMFEGEFGCTPGNTAGRSAPCRRARAPGRAMCRTYWTRRRRCGYWTSCRANGRATTRGGRAPNIARMR